MSATDGRFLIVNADDFGLSRGINRGIIRAHEQGIVTSASLMVRGPAAREAGELARSHPALGVGLHVDTGEWVYQDGEWRVKYAVVPAGAPAGVVEAEVRRQLAQFREIMGGDPTHLDSHQHVHRDEPLRSILVSLAGALHVPLRHGPPGVRYCGEFYGQAAKSWLHHEAIGAENLCRVLRNLPPGITELACHPGLDGDFDSAYSVEREMEVETLCSGAVRGTIDAAGISLCSFRDLPALSQDH